MSTLSPTSAKSTLSPTTTAPPSRNPQRPPPPSLFLGPPSQNASAISLSSIQPTTSRTQAPAPLLRNRSAGGPDALRNPITSSSLPRSSQQQRQQLLHQNEGDRTDALWAEMQATLAEVELSAARGTHFFGPEHSAALEELRTAQISLAQAWARSEADEIVDHPSEHDDDAGNSASPSGNKDGEDRGKGLEEETEGDILLGRKRREANDKYFKRVNVGVLDVVGRLEEVAVAMEKVERESREIWSESESIGSVSGSS
ncbi:MAG: hypothetical protein Q9187_002225 [Circinaria calcarea]